MVTISSHVVEEIADQLFEANDIEERVVENGFVVVRESLRGKVVYIGFDQNDYYGIVAMARESETIEQESERYETTESKHVKAKLYRAELAMTPRISDEFVEHVTEQTKENGELIDKGWLHGYRLRDLGDMLDENFVDR